MEPCIFCDIVSGTIPAHIVHEDEHTLAFAPLKDSVLAQGHLLVIPKTHAPDITSISPDTLEQVMGTVRTLSILLTERYGANGINLLHASGKDAQQSVPHFHIHLVPRRSDDGIDAWPHTGYADDTYPAAYEKIRDVLNPH